MKIYGPCKIYGPVGKYTVLPENIRSWRKIYGPLLKIYGLLLKIYGQVRKIYGPDRKIYGPFQIVMSHISDVYFPVFEWVISRTVYFSSKDRIFSAKRPYIFKIWGPYILEDRIFYVEGPYIFRKKTVYFQPGPYILLVTQYFTESDVDF